MENNQKWEELKEDLLDLRKIFQSRIDGTADLYWEDPDLIERDRRESRQKLEIVDQLLEKHFEIPMEFFDEKTNEWRVFTLEELLERTKLKES